MLYGVSLLEFALSYRAEYDEYVLKRLDYEGMVSRGVVEPQIIDDIPAPEVYIKESKMALLRSFELLNGVNDVNSGQKGAKRPEKSLKTEKTTINI